MALDRLTPFDRVPPQNLEAEQAVLGSMLIERAAVEKAAEILKPEDFYRDAHRYIFEAMLALTERDEPVDPLTVADELNMRGQFEIAGGRIYLVNLMEAPATAANIEYYARMVEEKAILRRLMDVGTQIQGLAYAEFESIDDVMDRAERLVFEIGQRRMGQFFYHLRPLLDEELDRIEKRYENRDGTGSGGRKTPFDDLNYKTNGLNPSDLIIVAARPGMGKCLPAYTLIDNPLTGERQTLEACIQERLPLIYGVSETGAIRTTAVSDWIDSGVQLTYRVRTRTGRSVDVTGHHPFLTVHGWTPLHCLEPGDKIGVPRGVPCFGQDTYAPGLARLMAYFVAEGGLSGTSPRFTNTDPVLVADFKALVAAHFPQCAIRQYGIDYAVVKAQRSNLSNPVTVWLHELGLMGKKADAKRLPDCVWRWKREHLAEFLRVLFSCDGTIYSMAGYGRIEFAVASETLAQDTHHALTRFGIVSKLWRKSERCWRVEITEPQSVERYQTEIGWLGEKASRAYRVTQGDTRLSIVGHPPQEVWAIVRTEAARCGLSLSELARRSGEKSAGKGGYNPHTNRSLPRTRLAGYADVLDSPRLRQIASADLYWDEIVSIEALGAQQVYDLTVPDGSNFIAQDVCVHNTSLTVQIAQYVAINEQTPVAIFSLEMSKEQLVTRMICSESKVDAHRLRTGSLLSDDWQRVGEGISRLAEAPIYIDDSPDISAMEMRAKCRRLKAEHGLGLIVIDYLQLMRSHKKTDNRTQEISEIARACKQLARELKVPVIALSQLSRAVESRPDKRPMLSDLRECVIGDTRLTDAHTGRQTPIRDVQVGNSILGMGRDQKIGAYTVQDVWSTGIKSVSTLTTRTGRQVTASANHPFLTAQGWKRLDELQAGDVIATAMHLPPHGIDRPDRQDLCRLLGYLAGDGTYQKHRSVGFCGSDPAVVADVQAIVGHYFPDVRWREKKVYGTYQEGDFSCTYANGYGRPYGNPLREWLRCVGVFGQKDDTKAIPDWVFEAGETGAREFLAGYLSTDGCVKIQQVGKHTRCVVHFDTVSRRLAEDVQMLLLRLGVVASIDKGRISDKATRPIYRINVMAFADNLRRFVEQVQPVGVKSKLLTQVLTQLAMTVTNGSLFSLPIEVSEQMFEKTKHLRQQGRKLEGRRLYWKHQGKRPHRASCADIAARMEDAELQVWANSDLLWEEIKSIESAGEQETFDIKVECANFLANGVVAHNSGSIEAEADIVMFIYRDAYYKMKEAGQDDEGGGHHQERDNQGVQAMEETELILAKHRSGPTGKVFVGFMPNFTRFENLTDREPGDAGE